MQLPDLQLSYALDEKYLCIFVSDLLPNDFIRPLVLELEEHILFFISLSPTFKILLLLC